MLLSEVDIEKLEKAGTRRKHFARSDRQGYVRLRNRGGYCVFYDPKLKQCRVYSCRPLGCQVYPVIYSVEDGVIIDDLCPMCNSVSEEELQRKGKKVVKLLETIDDEAAKRRQTVKRSALVLHKDCNQS
jgi:hypothetical protein